jgi:hypothetical protein
MGRRVNTDISETIDAMYYVDAYDDEPALELTIDASADYAAGRSVVVRQLTREQVATLRDVCEAALDHWSGDNPPPGKVGK